MQILKVIFVVIIATGLQTQICAINGHTNFDFEHHIRKRSLEKDGFTDFHYASVTFSYNSDIKHKHSRGLRDTEQQLHGKIIELQLAADDIRFEFVLSHAKSVVNDNTLVRVFDGNEETQMRIPSQDCFLSGHLKEYPDEPAIITYCNGLRGTFSDGSYSYHIESLDSDDVEETVFTARIEKPFVYDTYEHLNESINYSQERHKRAILGTLDIETVLILDAEYVAKMRSNGHATNQSLIHLMAMKWDGVQAEWGRANVLNYEITISIVEIVIWETNPDWYTPSTVLESTLSSVCTGANSRSLWADADHIHLFTGRTGTDVAGRAYTGDICVDGRKCAVSTNTHEDEYVIAAHELGHSMGMAHDIDVGCPSPNDGIMGSKTASWSTCSVAAMNLEVQKAESSCLTTDNVASANVITLQEAWPGMVYSGDEICEFKYGPGFRIKSSRTSCSGIRCMNMDPNSANYTITYSYPTPTDGSYCGPQMVCSTQITNNAYHCISWNDTGLDPALFIVVVGGWSAWGSLSSCSRTCGAGLQYRQRTCSNPKPQNSAWCEGSEYDAQLCNTQPCAGDSNVESTLITQRAAETCTHWKTSNLYAAIEKVSSNYLNTGDKYGNTGDDQCEVKCNTIAGYTANGERHGIMPDGTPCAHSSLSSYEEVNNLPRRPGMYGLCLKGICTLFGCDNVAGSVQKDGCGVCGGDNSTCQIISGVYTTILASSSRGTIAAIPTGSSLMQFYFTYSNMQYNFLELRTKDNVVVINFQALDTTGNPVNFAGTYWYLLATKQYLYADGPIDQPVTIQLYNYLSNPNTGVNYAYSVPTAAATCTDTCANGGTYNSTICSCSCLTGYYGNTCSTQCSKVCKNGMVPTSTLSNCQCNCLNNTYGTNCNCKYPFTGVNCNDCKKTTCLNGGTFNATACRCSCPQGYGDLDCSTPCEDKGAATVNCTNKASLGHCASQNEVMEANCYLTCGLCTLITTTTSTSTTTSTTSSTTTTSSTSPTTASTTPSTDSTTPSTASTTPSTASTSSTTPTTASTTPTTASTASSTPTTASTDSTSTSPSTASTSSSTTSPTTTSTTTTAPAPTTPSTATTASTAATTANTAATTTLISCPEQYVECGGADSIFVQLSTYIGLLLLHLVSELPMRF